MSVYNNLARSPVLSLSSSVLSDKPQGSKNDYKKKMKDRKIARFFYLKLRYFCTLIYIFCCCLVFLWSFSYSTLINSSILKYQKELSNLQDENIALRVQIAEQIDLKYIEDIATTRLGMAKPKPYQERYISVPKSDHTITFEDENFVNKKRRPFPILGNLYNFFERLGALWDR